MRTIIVWCCLLAVFIEPCMSDMYMHFPHGSNNRLNGNQDNVKNANRLFDSQVRRLSIHNFLIGASVFGEVRTESNRNMHLHFDWLQTQKLFLATQIDSHLHAYLSFCLLYLTKKMLIDNVSN